jgi:hypothetical protein
VDVFAWGHLVGYAATGRPPLGTGPEALATTGAPDRADLEPPLRDLVAAALHPDPAKRPSAAELVEMMGQAGYDELARHCEAHLRSRSALALHPADPR